MGRPQPLFRLIFLPLVLVMTVSVAVLGWYAERSSRQTSHQESVDDLAAAANLAAFRVALDLTANPASIKATCREMGHESVRRVTVVFPTGEVACDSAVADRSSISDLSRSPEILEALAGREGHAVRPSRTLNRLFLYVAVPLRREGRVVAALRLGLLYPQERQRAIHTQLVWASLAIILLGAAGSYLIARRISAPIERLTRAVDQFASGDLNGRLAPPRVAEVAKLAAALNAMADQLDVRIAWIEAQRRLRETILTAMEEGVIAVDPSGRILLINHTAAGLLGLSATTAVGSEVPASPPLATLAGFVSSAVATAEAREEEITAGIGGGLRLLAHSAPLLDNAGARLGSVIILSDVSRLQRLERTRQDFVDNISHELRTPITIIKGYLELMLDGLLGDPANAKSSLEKVVRQAERMRVIIDDLLLLSRLDQPAAGRSPDFETAGLKDILAAAVAATEPDAREGAVRIELECEEQIQLPADPLLLTRAVANLVRNAIAHTAPGGRVLVRADCTRAAIVLSIRDWGTGIAREHLPRIFERFYRVDRARSRKRGGSGLGLAIAKHIVMFHGGTVSVESEAGQGSTFTITIPRGGVTPR